MGTCEACTKTWPACGAATNAFMDRGIFPMAGCATHFCARRDGVTEQPAPVEDERVREAKRWMKDFAEERDAARRDRDVDFNCLEKVNAERDASRAELDNAREHIKSLEGKIKRQKEAIRQLNDPKVGEAHRDYWKNKYWELVKTVTKSCEKCEFNNPPDKVRAWACDTCEKCSHFKEKGTMTVNGWICKAAKILLSGGKFQGSSCFYIHANRYDNDSFPITLTVEKEAKDGE